MTENQNLSSNNEEVHADIPQNKRIETRKYCKIWRFDSPAEANKFRLATSHDKKYYTLTQNDDRGNKKVHATDEACTKYEYQVVGTINSEKVWSTERFKKDYIDPPVFDPSKYQR